MAKKRVGQFPKAFRQTAVARLNQCREPRDTGEGARGESASIVYLREKLEPTASGAGPPANAREATLRKEVSQLKRVLAEKVLEVDFFTGALHTVEARRQRNGPAGAQASTPTSGT